MTYSSRRSKGNQERSSSTRKTSVAEQPAKQQASKKPHAQNVHPDSDIRNEQKQQLASPDLNFSSDTMRLNKALASAGICSRRQADVFIEEGRVKVNGAVITEMGYKVRPAHDTIEVQGTALPQGLRHDTPRRYILLHKPVQVVTTASDPQGRKTVVDLLPPALQRERLFPIGRLDFFSEGLLILTNDGELTNRLTHPRWHLPKVYHVRVRGSVTQEKLAQMRSGMRLAEGEKLAPVAVRRIESDDRSVLLEMILHQGINRQIRRMCRDLDLTVLRLIRVAQGSLELGRLPSGEHRELRPDEVHALRKAVGLAD